ncbi:CHAT domain-containing protein [Flavilitoribacter nigricans]|uniref:CHAT domain-containing protein n=1 Tax=Flavilitoribacter nigricans (strain ATCC 23147 / DSM 23189 / NBRC 102662 / NCIMB 1420 / SS-2) TaxID=1122177 RepID=A0A2D0MXE9_FLAN2|nr:CHAT domain-containing tetratricopeptide repeat protein [Flavilitoribacter nigricans]PHN00934.1 hypothetical protein CRP01_39760 [Flavilitoribacter nigricans DSM 23189 = NBRC 102662]
MKKVLILFFSLTIIFALVKVGQPFQQKKFYPPSIADYVHLEGVNLVFQQADFFKHSLDFERAVETFKELVVSELKDVDRIYALNQLGFCYLAMHMDSLAENCLREIESQNLSFRSYEAEADYHLNRGILFDHLDNWKDALRHLKMAASLYKKAYGIDHLRYAQTINQIGLLHYEYASSFDSALQYIIPAYELFQAHSEWQPFSKENEFAMALINQSQRDHRPGESHCDNALKLAQQAFYKDSLFMARCLNLKGNMLKKQKKYLEARKSFGQAIQLGRKLKSLHLQEFMADSIVNEIQIGIKEEDFLVVISDLEIMQPDRYFHPDRLRGYYYFGVNPSRSVQYYEQFLSNYRNDPQRNRHLLGEAYYSLGKMYQKLGIFDLAYRSFRDIMLYGTPYEGEDLTLGQIISPEVYHSYKYNYRSFANIAGVLLRKFNSQNDPVDLEWANRFCVLADSLTALPSPNDDAIITYQKEAGDEFYQVAMECTYLSYERNPNRSLLNQALRFSERMKSHILFRDMYSREKFDENLGKLFQDKIYFDWLKENGNRLNDEQVERYSVMIEALKNSYQDWGKYFAFDSILNIDYVQRSLASSEALVTYNYSKTQLSGIYIDKDTGFFFQNDPGNLPELIKSFRSQLEKSTIKNSKKWIKSSFELYTVLVKPFAQNLNGKSLLVIPDKELNLIPYEALITDTIYNKDSHNIYSKAPYLIINTQISYAPSWTVYLQTLKEGKDIPDNPTILAYTYGQRSHSWLSESESLLDTISSIFGGKQVQLAKNRACNKDHFYRNGEKYDILHFSIHGQSNPKQRWDSKLLFHPSKNSYDTLYAYEILQRKFNAKLVVLGACETGFGAIESSEGTYSLARAFIQAGVPTVISSLWEIDQTTTAYLLTYFYAELQHTLDPKEALRQAKLTYLSHGDNFLTHPGYWTGLICLL